MAVPTRKRIVDRANISPTDKLADFISEGGTSNVDVNLHVTLTKEALARADLRILSNSDVSYRAKRLAAAAERFAKELSAAVMPEQVQLTSDEGGAVQRPSQESIWPYMRIAELLRDGGFKDDVPLALQYGETSRSARAFDLAVGNPLALLLTARELEKRASIAAAAFSARKRPPDLRRRRLRTELAMIFRSAFVTEPAPRVGKADFEAPQSLFGQFVKLALETTDWDQRSRKEMFVSLVVTGARSNGQSRKK